MSKKPHVLWKILPPIVSVVAGFTYVIVRGLLGISDPLEITELGFLILTGIIVLVFPFLSRCWLCSLLSPLLYFAAIFISSENFATLVGIELAVPNFTGLPLRFSGVTELAIFAGWGIGSLYGFLVGLGFSIVRAKRDVGAPPLPIPKPVKEEVKPSPTPVPIPVPTLAPKPEPEPEPELEEEEEVIEEEVVEEEPEPELEEEEEV
ncbi:MAG: hypothetical protein JW776_11520, partial [Candidatus Lokiarchaeota archaeon]|nr:hypothetical protein [Candidatus Lokiarchaeota archaeon]